MPYTNDIFISYIRDNETKIWLERHFIPLLKSSLRFELGYPPEIWYDSRIDIGDTWPVELGEQVGNSKLMILLWSKTFLSSEWCTLEMSQMLKREVDCGFRQAQKSEGLVIPVIVHDGETLIAPLKIGQFLDLKDCFNSRMSIDSPKAETLAERIRQAAVGIANQIRNVPPWNADWNMEARNRFFDLYYNTADPVQGAVPRFN